MRAASQVLVVVQAAYLEDQSWWLEGHPAAARSGQILCWIIAANSGWRSFLFAGLKSIGFSCKVFHFKSSTCFVMATKQLGQLCHFPCVFACLCTSQSALSPGAFPVSSGCRYDERGIISGVLNSTEAAWVISVRCESTFAFTPNGMPFRGLIV